MEPNPVLACLAFLQHAGWHVAPVASPWRAVTELHAHRWWGGQLVDAAVVSLTTGQALAQRIQITSGPAGPAHAVVADTGFVPIEQLAATVDSWPGPIAGAAADAEAASAADPADGEWFVPPSNPGPVSNARDLDS